MIKIMICWTHRHKSIINRFSYQPNYFSLKSFILRLKNFFFYKKRYDNWQKSWSLRTTGTTQKVLRSFRTVKPSKSSTSIIFCYKNFLFSAGHAHFIRALQTLNKLTNKHRKVLKTFIYWYRGYSSPCPFWDHWYNKDSHCK